MSADQWRATHAGGITQEDGSRTQNSEGGMIRLETLIELRLLNSSFRAQISQFELCELILLLKLDKQFAVEQFEATGSQSTVPSPPLTSQFLTCSTPSSRGNHPEARGFAPRRFLFLRGGFPPDKAPDKAPSQTRCLLRRTGTFKGPPS